MTRAFEVLADCKTTLSAQSACPMEVQVSLIQVHVTLTQLGWGPSWLIVMQDSPLAILSIIRLMTCLGVGHKKETVAVSIALADVLLLGEVLIPHLYVKWHKKFATMHMPLLKRCQWMELGSVVLGYDMTNLTPPYNLLTHVAATLLVVVPIRKHKNSRSKKEYFVTLFYE